jgi:hypothetical protein
MNNMIPENQSLTNLSSPDLILDLWSRTYNTMGKPDWSHLFPYYHDDIVFQDPIQVVTGKQAFIEMCNRLSNRCEQLEMDISSLASAPSVFFMEWKMTMIFRKTPSTAIFGCTKLTLALDGRIIRQRDYYDLWGDIFPNVPVMRKVYPKIMHRLFG